MLARTQKWEMELRKATHIFGIRITGKLADLCFVGYNLDKVVPVTVYHNGKQQPVIVELDKRILLKFSDIHTQEYVNCHP